MSYNEHNYFFSEIVNLKPVIEVIHLLKKNIENLAGTIFNLLSFKFKVAALVYLNTCVIVNSRYCCLCLILFGLLTGLVVVRKKTCDRPNSPF